MFAIAVAGWHGHDRGFDRGWAQSLSWPGEASPSAAPPPAANPAPANPSGGANAQAPAPVQHAKHDPNDPTDEQKKQIADNCANLLKLASNLKAEVDKTTVNELSVSVVRKAGEIEQLAHKMREK